jgi:hypothetical protein
MSVLKGKLSESAFLLQDCLSGENALAIYAIGGHCTWLGVLGLSHFNREARPMK